MRLVRILHRYLLASIMLMGFAMPGLAQETPASFKRHIVLPVFVDGLEMRQTRFALEMAYAAIGIKVSFVARPALRALLEADSGQVDGEVVRDNSIEASAPNLVRVDVPMFRYVGSAFVLKGSELPTSLEAASRLPSVGIVRGARRVEVETQGWSNLVPINDHGAAVRMLKIGRISTLIGAYEVVKDAILSNQFSENDFSSHEMYSIQVFHYLHKSHADIIPALGLQLNRLKGSQATVLDGLRASKIKDFPRQ
ncbi:hypothetical protein H8L32_25440 [Undibacterium sp. CY18W]|uniref:Solute-binding protein family 3/N-terminal domain-containing protein n=1 Tax=Undibacterium hunanense TaxID=2762292 RepID=A0ABR6ZYV2_9BURK|nr:hypothetical protein [Undibacterium hunanense]MBC3920834.1 hypothetical protein [Undibacterium hunanense]